MKDADKAADFATILGAAVHDMKNSLWLLQQNLNHLAQQLEQSPAATDVANIQYEAQRLNTGLIQLLSLYRNEYSELPVQPELQFLDELIEEITEDTRLYADNLNIRIETDCVSELSWYYDPQLITVLLQDVLINAIRYARKQVNLVIGKENDMLCIEVTDDGEGYPESILQDQADSRTDIRSGRTGLGLYFARRIAHAHQRQGQHGIVRLGNQPAGGGIFTLLLP